MQVLLRDILISIGVVFGILLVASVITKKYKLISWNSICAILFTFFMGVIFSLTGISPISGFGLRNLGQGINLIPFVGIVEMIQEGIDFYSIANIVGNFLMFVPIGFFAPILYKKYNGLVKATILGAVISLVIECSQMFLIRGTDIDDIILNTLGAMLGYGCYKMYRMIMPKLSKTIAKANQRNNVKVFWICVVVPYITIIIGGFYDRAQFMKNVL